ncbi:MAG: hypothetical protein AAGH15_09505 [Myxococcota bacterium]
MALSPVKLEDAVVETLAAAIEKGTTVKLACLEAGISRVTFWRWLKEGAKDEADEELQLFALRMERALAKAENTLVQVVRNGKDIKGQPDWKAAAHMLAVRNPKEFAKRTVNEHIISAGVESFMDQLLPLLSESARAEVVDVTARLKGVGDEVAGEDEA